MQLKEIIPKEVILIKKIEFVCLRELIKQTSFENVIPLCHELLMIWKI